jgi:hypothetical protein
MPRPASGNPPWKSFAVKLPPELLERLRRYADLHRTTPAALMREGVEWRLSGTTAASDVPAAPLPPLVLARLAQTLTATASQLNQVAYMVENTYGCSGDTETEYAAVLPAPVSLSGGDGGNTTTEDAPEYANTTPVETSLGCNGNTTSNCPPFDSRRHVLGKLCLRGHEHGHTGQSLRRVGNMGCLKCEAEHARERRRRQTRQS